MSHHRGHEIPDLMLERYRLGELTDAERARIAALAARDARIAARLRELDRSDADLVERLPMTDLARAIRARVDRAPRSRRRFKAIGLVALGGAAAAVLLAVTLWPAPQDRIKGLEPSIVVYRQTPHGSERLADDALAHRGDVLRLGYVAAGARYGVIVSADGRGVVTLHLPKTDTNAAPLSAGPAVLLDQAYELDDAPAIERFYFVTGASPFTVATVKDAVTRAIAKQPGTAPARLALPKDLNQFTVAVRKD